MLKGRKYQAEFNNPYAFEDLGGSAAISQTLAAEALTARVLELRSQSSPGQHH